MKQHKLLSITLAVSLLTTFNSCVKDLDTVPLDKTVSTSATLFDNPASYKQFLAKLYGSLNLTGQQGRYGKPEIANPDEGETSFMRQYWTAQEVSTDEVICAWGDAGLEDYRGHSWSPNNRHIQLLYQRIYINIAYCNEFIRSVEPKINTFQGTQKEDVVKFVAEARFLRALHYYFALDFWGNVPFVTEKDITGAFLPKQIKRDALFAYIESELLAILPSLAPAKTNEYARADQGAASMLLAKLYLNSEVYLGKGKGRYADCITYCNKIINSGYALTTNYKDLFLADNHIRREEIIFPIAEDGLFSRTYGSTTFIIHAAVGGSEDAANGFGIAAGGWQGNRLRKTMINKFVDPSGATDRRAIFHSAGQTLEINHPVIFAEGYLSSKFKNVTSTGAIGNDGMFVDTDFPLFRFADVYLMFAEAALRNQSNQGEALNYINHLRERAFGNATGNITGSDLTLDFILDERARELHFEGHRRTDLIRFDKFTGSTYIWDWKGNVKAGVATSEIHNLFPIPTSDIAVNTNLIQNAGY